MDSQINSLASLFSSVFNLPLSTPKLVDDGKLDGQIIALAAAHKELNNALSELAAGSVPFAASMADLRVACIVRVNHAAA